MSQVLLNIHLCILPYIITIWIYFSTEPNWTIAVNELLVKRRTRIPHPITSVYRPISIQQ